MGAQSDLYQSITDRIIAELERGCAPWVKPWKDGHAGGALPHNAITGRPYHGINTILLWGASALYGSQQWLTFKQAEERGGHVKRGEKGTQIVFWKFRTVRDSETQEERTIPMLRTYYVFNVAQCEDLELPRRRNADSLQPIPATEIDQRIAMTGAHITHGGDAACYVPSADAIHMPKREQFRSLDHYHATLLHELTHWTGAKSRCARDLSGRFGSQAYAAEELIAEIGSAFLCASFGVALDELQHPAYIANWLDVLRNDNRAIFTAAKLAQQAADLILQSCGMLEGDEPDSELAEAA